MEQHAAFDHDTEEEAPRVRRLCLCVDIERYSPHDMATQKRLQQALDDTLTQAAEAGGVSRLEWSRQDTGDGGIALLPPGIDERVFLPGFVRGLEDALFRHNKKSSPRLRVRVAAHAGLTQLAPSGWAGGAVIQVARLCDAEQFRTVLKDCPGDFALILSDPLFQDYVQDDLPRFTRADFRHLRVETRSKGFFADAWVLCASTSGVHEPGRAIAAPPAPEPATSSGPGHSSRSAGRDYVENSGSGTITTHHSDGPAR